MIEERFSERDVAPNDEAAHLARREGLDRTAAALAVLAAGIWVGGMIGLGACAAPFVFRLTPSPFSGDAMGAAFLRFDQVVLGCAVSLLGAEVVRTWASGRQGARPLARARRLIAVALAVAATYGGLALTPRIVGLHQAGAHRGVGLLGEELARAHGRAELLGKLEIALAVVLIVLHVFTLSPLRSDAAEGEAPIPPGPPD
jgi:hypothetical protein